MWNSTENWWCFVRISNVWFPAVTLTIYLQHHSQIGCWPSINKYWYPILYKSDEKVIVSPPKKHVVTRVTLFYVKCACLTSHCDVDLWLWGHPSTGFLAKIHIIFLPNLVYINQNFFERSCFNEKWTILPRWHLPLTLTFQKSKYPSFSIKLIYHVDFMLICWEFIELYIWSAHRQTETKKMLAHSERQTETLSVLVVRLPRLSN